LTVIAAQSSVEKHEAIFKVTFISYLSDRNRIFCSLCLSVD